MKNAHTMTMSRPLSWEERLSIAAILKQQLKEIPMIAVKEIMFTQDALAHVSSAGRQIKPHTPKKE